MKVVMGLPAAALLFWFTLLGRLGLILNSDFAITFAKILGDLSDGDGYYRLDYRYREISRNRAVRNQEQN